MNIKKTISIVVALVSLFVNQSYASLTFNLDSIANGTMPTSTSPWLTAEFVDSTGGGVDLILTSHLNVSSEYITRFAFNVNPSKNLSISPIVFTDFGTPTALTISQGQNDRNLTGKAVGGFDILINWQTDNNPSSGRFNGNDVDTFHLTGIGLTADDFNYASAQGWKVAAKVQGIPFGTTTISGDITAVPEPSTYLAGMFAMCPMLMMCLRNRKQ
jgi:hypothetical protein